MKTALLIISALMLGVVDAHADDVSLTVYNSNLAVVNVSKEMKFKRGWVVQARYLLVIMKMYVQIL